MDRAEAPRLTVNVTQAQIARKAVVEASSGPAAEAIRSLWIQTQTYLHRSAPAAAGGFVQLAGQQQESTR